MQCACAILPSVACPALQYFFFPHYLITGTISVSIFSITFVWNISYSKNWVRYDQKRILVFTWSTRHSRQILMQLKFSRQVFEKYATTKFHENPSSGSRVVPCGETDGRTDMTMLIVAFRNLENASKNSRTIDFFSTVFPKSLTRCHLSFINVNRRQNRVCGGWWGEGIVGWANSAWIYRLYRHSCIGVSDSLFATHSYTTHCEFEERDTNNKYQQTPPPFNR